MEYRKLIISDYEEYNKIRTNALNIVPEAFASTNEEEMANRKQRFISIVIHPFNFLMGAFDNELLVGLVAFVKEEKNKLKYKGIIGGMFVDPLKQGEGIGYQLVIKTVDTAFEIEELKKINLQVVTTNVNAVRLYEKTGFISYGLEESALCVNGQFFDVYLMVRFR